MSVRIATFNVENLAARGIMRLVVRSLLFLGLTGCTAIPRAELNSYREAFDATRAVGEQIVLEFRVVREEHDALVQEVATEHIRHGEIDPADVGPLGIAFRPRDAFEQGGGPDAVEVRLAAWRIAARYNDALLALAEGRTQEEIATTVDGLLRSLKEFPVDDIAEIAVDVVPYAGAIKAAIGVIEKELAAKRFRQAVLAGSKIMGVFFELLVTDADAVWDAKSALLENEYDQLVSRAAQRTRRFIRVATPLKRPADRDILKWISTINDRRTQLFDTRDSDLIVLEASDTGGDPTQEQQAQLLTLQDEIVQLIAEAQTTRESLIAFRELMHQYMILLRRTSDVLEQLNRAAQRRADPQLSVTQLTAVIAAAREAYTIYKEAS